MDETDLGRYQNSLKIYRDLKGVIDTAFDEGKLEGKIEVAKALRAKGLPIEVIESSIGRPFDEIERR